MKLHNLYSNLQQLMVEYNNTSLAYVRILDVILSGKSFIKHKKSNGVALYPEVPQM